ncbi:hypothetical protein B0I37DRAFT_377028 [Chaetomium sp. MPI-CAGE-AT-0009]|nr:hypothetical protein B0I37DRAFT_377028 [Chaetomium sp. MPI-CAGE-AT-0009]
MASSPNGAPPSDGASVSSGSRVFTPPSSDDSHASTAGSADSTSSNQSREPSYQLVSYVAQPATEDGSLYGRLAVDQPPVVNLAGRIAFYTARAQQTTGPISVASSPSRNDAR